MATAPKICDRLRTRARNLERYPFESATMVEAGRLAGNERKIANEYERACWLCEKPATGTRAYFGDYVPMCGDHLGREGDQ